MWVGRWVIEVDETNRRMTGCRRCEGETKLTAGWLDDEVCRCTGSSSSGTAGVEDHKEVVAGLQT